jgi:hypothetical protein
MDEIRRRDGGATQVRAEELPINTKAQRSPLGLDTVPLSPTNFMNALILGARHNDCKPPPGTANLPIGGFRVSRPKPGAHRCNENFLMLPAGFRHL